MINPLYRGGWPCSVRSAIAQKCYRARVEATLRHRTYSYGFAHALRLWKAVSFADCWGLGPEGHTHSRPRNRRSKLPNLARERVNFREVPF